MTQACAIADRGHSPSFRAGSALGRGAIGRLSPMDRNKITMLVLVAIMAFALMGYLVRPPHEIPLPPQVNHAAWFGDGHA